MIQSPSQSVNQRRKALDQLRLYSIPQEAGRFGNGRLSWAKRSRGIKGLGNWTLAPTLDASWLLLKRVILRLTGKDSVRRWDRELRWERSLVFKRSYLDIFNDFKSPGLEHWKLLQMSLPNCLLCHYGVAQEHLQASTKLSGNWEHVMLRRARLFLW